MNFLIGILIALALIQGHHGIEIEEEFIVNQPSHNSNIHNVRDKRNIFTEITRNISSLYLSQLIHGDRINVSNHFIDDNPKILFFDVFVHSFEDVPESKFSYYHDGKNIYIRLNTKPESMTISGRYHLIRKNSMENIVSKFDVFLNTTFARSSNSSIRQKRKSMKINIDSSTKYLGEITRNIQMIIEPIIQEILDEKLARYINAFPFLRGGINSKFDDYMNLMFFYAPKNRHRIGPVEMHGLGDSMNNFEIAVYRVASNNESRLAYSFTNKNPIFGTFVYFNNTANEYEKNPMKGYNIYYTIHQFTINVAMENATINDDANVEFSSVDCTSKIGDLTSKSLQIICRDFFSKALKYILSRKVIRDYTSSEDNIYLTPYNTYVTPIGSFGYFD